MRVKIITLTCILAGISLAGFSQIKDEPRSIQEGKWVLEKESVQANKACNHQEGAHAHKVDIKDVDVVIYTEIKVKQDTLFFISAKGTLQTTYVYTKKTGINFDSPNFPFSGGGNVIANKLYLQQKIADPLDENSPIYVSFIYEYKN